MKSFTLTATLLSAQIVAACQGSQSYSPTAPMNPPTTSPPTTSSSADVESWSLVSSVTSETGPADSCWVHYQGHVEASYSLEMGVQRSGASVSFTVPMDADPAERSVYEGTVTGRAFEARTYGDFSGNPQCGPRVDYTVSGRFSDNGRQLTATEVQVYRLTSGEEAINTLAWAAHRN